MHGRDAGHRISGIDGRLDACRAAVFGQERGVEIDDGLAGEGEDVFAQDLAVGHDDENLRIKRGEFIRGIADFLRLIDGDSGGKGLGFDGGRREGLVAADGFVRLGDQRQRARPMLQQMPERWQRDVPGGNEHKPHADMFLTVFPD